MGQFIAGNLVESKDGAMYEGVVYDRLLKLQLPTGEIVSIFDGFNPISSGLSTGKWYEVVLLSLPVPGSIRYTEQPTFSKANNIWQGTVIEPKWAGKAEDYKFVRKYNFDNIERVQLRMKWGYLLMNPKALGIPVEVGATICWESMRLDLLAVV